MKKIDMRFLLILFLIFTCGCKTTSKTQTLYVISSSIYKHPLSIGIGNFFPFGSTLNLIDTTNVSLNYKFVPGETFSINTDTTIFLFYSDSITIDHRTDKLLLHSVNSDNIKYNQFYKDVSIALAPIYRNHMNYFFDKEKNVIEDEHYIDNYLSQSDNLITQQVSILCNRYQFNQNTRFELIKSEVETKKLARSYFYLGSYIQKLGSLNRIQTRLKYYIDRINQQHLSVFSQQDIALLIEGISHVLINKSISHLRSKEEIQNYYSLINQFFIKRSISYDYLISSLEVQAKKNKLKFSSGKLRFLKRDAKKSKFKKYVHAKYSSENEALRDSPIDQNLYDTRFHSDNLNSITSQFKSKPLLIDFWASWCLPCIKKIPETLAYKTKYPALDILFISIDKSHDVWKSYLYDHDLIGILQYRRNYQNQDSLFSKIQVIPKYGLLNKYGQIELVDELSDSMIKKYCESFLPHL